MRPGRDQEGTRAAAARRRRISESASTGRSPVDIPEMVEHSSPGGTRRVTENEMEGSYEMGSPLGGAARTARHVTPVTTAARVRRGDRVVITGASGFIGSAVVRAVQARGAVVVAVVEPEADARNLKGIDTERAVLDIRDPDAVRAACKGARFVIHLAAVYRFWARDPKIFYEVNVGGTLNVLDAVGGRGLRAAGVHLHRRRSRAGEDQAGPAGRRDVPHRYRTPVRALQEIQVRRRARGAQGQRRRSGRLPGPAHLSAGAPGPAPDTDRKAGARLPQRQDARVRGHRHERHARR